ncbi:hypothetical protein C8R45DRAFT_935259 [Mycena sanguinolenta]|nr:hypothetical protein C8R45DRAFT_935259 [Mycena sanguinolenta]
MTIELGECQLGGRIRMINSINKILPTLSAARAPPAQPVRHLRPQAHGNEPAVQQAEGAGGQQGQGQVLSQCPQGYALPPPQPGASVSASASASAGNNGQSAVQMAPPNGGMVLPPNSGMGVPTPPMANSGGQSNALRGPASFPPFSAHALAAERVPACSGTWAAAVVGVGRQHQQLAGVQPMPGAGANPNVGVGRGVQQQGQVGALHTRIELASSLLSWMVLNMLWGKDILPSSASMEPYAVCASNGKEPEVVWEL